MPSITIRISDTLKNALEARAEKERRSLNNLIVRVLEEAREVWDVENMADSLGHPIGPEGHAPGHLRKALIDVLKGHQMEDFEGNVQVGDERRPLTWLLAQLWRCTDIIPSSLRDHLDLSGVWTYGAAARAQAMEEHILDNLEQAHGIGPNFDSYQAEIAEALTEYGERMGAQVGENLEQLAARLEGRGDADDMLREALEQAGLKDVVERFDAVGWYRVAPPFLQTPLEGSE